MLNWQKDQNSTGNPLRVRLQVWRQKTNPQILLALISISNILWFYLRTTSICNNLLLDLYSRLMIADPNHQFSSPASVEAFLCESEILFKKPKH